MKTPPPAANAVDQEKQPRVSLMATAPPLRATSMLISRHRTWGRDHPAASVPPAGGRAHQRPADQRDQEGPDGGPARWLLAGSLVLTRGPWIARRELEDNAEGIFDENGSGS
jgi:hypothetical protein